MIKHLCIFSLVCLFAVLPAAGEEKPHDPISHLPALKGDYFRLDAAKIGRPFHIFTAYPEGYDPAQPQLYPTVYVLDGDSLFSMIAPHSLFLHYDDKLPKVIVVGIAYGSFDPAVNKRGFDYSMPAPDADAEQGGAPAFHAFIKDELIPQIEARYRSDPARRILIGQSRGGHFVHYSAMHDPDLFWGRIASASNFRPGESFFQSGAPAKATRRELKLLAVSGTEDRPNLRAQALAWDEAWKKRSDAPWERRLVSIEGGTHAANILDAYRAGMRWFFDYKPAP